MTPRQFEIWKAKPQGFEQSHWFVIISGNERCAHERFNAVNGLACFTLRGVPLNADVRLNNADGFERPTVCGCDYFFPIPKSSLQEKLGVVSFERQQQIKTRIEESLRL
jgi:hypothetical protein